MHEGVQRGIKLTTRLLASTKDQDRGFQPSDLNELLEQLQAFLRYGVGPDVGVAFELAPSLPPCVIDAVQFNAAILNLVVNARDAMPRGGEITISTAVVSEPARAIRGSRTFVHLRVQDNGQGMSRTVLRRIFDRHFTTKGGVGTGLGVPQVCAFMSRAGGHINVKSAVGLGTTFDLVFPVDLSAALADNTGRRGELCVDKGGAREESYPPSSIEIDASGANACGTGREPADARWHQMDIRIAADTTVMPARS
jgi:signal transduction histidine kinase